jgi:hypothetical protein
MSVTLGVALIGVGAVLACLVMFAMWHRLAAVPAFGLLALAGALVAAGGLRVQGATDAGSWVIAVGLLGALGPLHARVVLGRPGPQR